MAWDIKCNLQTGDWEFKPNRDLAVAIGTDVMQQRVHTRLVIARGAWFYDATGTLGSRLHELFPLPYTIGASAIEQMAREALAPMDDLAIDEVQVVGNEDDERKIDVRIVYRPAGVTPNQPASAATFTLNAT